LADWYAPMTERVCVRSAVVVCSVTRLTVLVDASRLTGWLVASPIQRSPAARFSGWLGFSRWSFLGKGTTDDQPSLPASASEILESMLETGCRRLRGGSGGGGGAVRLGKYLLFLDTDYWFCCSLTYGICRLDVVVLEKLNTDAQTTAENVLRRK